MTQALLGLASIMVQVKPPVQRRAYPQHVPRTAQENRPSERSAQGRDSNPLPGRHDPCGTASSPRFTSSSPAARNDGSLSRPPPPRASRAPPNARDDAPKPPRRLKRTRALRNVNKLPRSPCAQLFSSSEALVLQGLLAQCRGRPPGQSRGRVARNRRPTTTLALRLALAAPSLPWLWPARLHAAPSRTAPSSQPPPPPRPALLPLAEITLQQSKEFPHPHKERNKSTKPEINTRKRQRAPKRKRRRKRGFISFLPPSFLSTTLPPSLPPSPLPTLPPLLFSPSPPCLPSPPSLPLPPPGLTLRLHASPHPTSPLLLLPPSSSFASHPAFSSFSPPPSLSSSLLFFTPSFPPTILPSLRFPYFFSRSSSHSASTESNYSSGPSVNSDGSRPVCVGSGRGAGRHLRRRPPPPPPALAFPLRRRLHTV
ncbi:hypothetical protein C7M84_006743 [Penaeus vannamei]|uniref:Uncharacterized protein n=1 Tax=Penaeus vannamei TaxID=6689 RepID=A0A3R7PRF8_PENVA|nr:hypothetical protein C7M84_006743 [Penaeus vannamei]